MDERAHMSSPLEAALAKLKKREESLWGKAQNLSHRWLAQLEGSLFFHHYPKLRKKPLGIPSLRAEPAIDLDSLFVVSLLFHLLALFLLAQVTLRPAVTATPEPIVVRLLEFTAPAEEGAREKPRTKTERKASSRNRPVPSPASPEPVQTMPAEPAPKPAPPLPGPRALAQTPVTKDPGVAGKPADSLIQLPTRSSNPEATSRATAVDLAPGTLAQSKGSLSEVARQGHSSQPASAPGAGGLAALSSADFGPYLDKIKRKVQSTWKYPEGISGTHQVNVVFVIDRGGKLVRVEVLDSSEPRLDNSALKAMRQASPFPPIPESLRELAGMPLRIKFSIDFGVRLRQ